MFLVQCNLCIYCYLDIVLFIGLIIHEFCLYTFLPLSKRHVGDLGNVIREHNGRIKTRRVDYLATLYGKESIIGRGIVVGIRFTILLIACLFLDRPALYLFPKEQ